MKQFLFNMKKCYDLTPDIKNVPISRCTTCADLGPCRAYFMISRKKGLI